MSPVEPIGIGHPVGRSDLCRFRAGQHDRFIGVGPLFQHEGRY